MDFFIVIRLTDGMLISNLPIFLTNLVTLMLVISILYFKLTFKE